MSSESDIPAARPKPSVRLHRVARLAGVAPSTASAALNGKPGVAPATRARVIAAARELGFRPDAVARTLRTGSAPAVGLVVDPAAYATQSRLPEALTTQYLLSVVEELSAAGIPVYQVTLSRMEVIRDLPISAIQIVTVAPEVTLPAGFAFGLPLIHSAGSLDHEGPTVHLRHDFAALLRDVMAHFVAEGAKCPALIQRDGPTSWGDEITSEYIAWCRDTHREPIVHRCVGAPEEVASLTTRMVEDGADAIFSLVGECPSMVAGVRAAGKSVPKDVLLAGFGDGSAEAMMTPPATVLSMCGRENGKLVAQTMVDSMATGDWPTKLRAHHRLIVRESSARTTAVQPPS